MIDRWIESGGAAWAPAPKIKALTAQAAAAAQK